MKFKILLSLVSLISFTAFSQGNNGLVAHWNFNGNANDVSGNNLNGTVTGATLVPGYAGIPNTAYRFNGTSNHIDVAYNSLLNLDSFSVCALVKVSGFYSGTCQENEIIIRGNDASDPQAYSISYSDNPYDNSCNIYSPTHDIFGTVAHNSSTSPPYSAYLTANNPFIDTNVWYCVTSTYDGNSIRMYIDGVLVVHVSYPDTYSPGTEGISIGYMSTGLPNFPYWFSGIIDDIRLYGRALSYIEVVSYCDTAKQNTSDALIRNISTANFSVSPNPAHSNITIQIAGNIGNSEIQIMNIYGQLITKFVASKTMNLDISMLPPGIYIIKAEIDRKVFFKKILKE